MDSDLVQETKAKLDEVKKQYEDLMAKKQEIDNALQQLQQSMIFLSGKLEGLKAMQKDDGPIKESKEPTGTMEK